jgi:hypothetical protein
MQLSSAITADLALGRPTGSRWDSPPHPPLCLRRRYLASSAAHRGSSGPGFAEADGERDWNDTPPPRPRCTFRSLRRRALLAIETRARSARGSPRPTRAQRTLRSCWVSTPSVLRICRDRSGARRGRSLRQAWELQRPVADAGPTPDSWRSLVRPRSLGSVVAAQPRRGCQRAVPSVPSAGGDVHSSLRDAAARPGPGVRDA